MTYRIFNQKLLETAVISDHICVLGRILKYRITLRHVWCNHLTSDLCRAFESKLCNVTAWCISQLACILCRVFSARANMAATVQLEGPDTCSRTASRPWAPSWGSFTWRSVRLVKQLRIVIRICWMWRFNHAGVDNNVKEFILRLVWRVLCFNMRMKNLKMNKCFFSAPNNHLSVNRTALIHEEKRENIQITLQKCGYKQEKAN